MNPHTLSVTVDIEDWYHIPSVTGSPFSVYRDTDEFFRRWEGRYDFLTEPTRRTLDLLDDLEITATFFVVAGVVERYPGLVESIVERGHEIGCHGLHHGCTLDPGTKQPFLPPPEFEAQTIAAKAILEKVSRAPVVGYRAPSAYLGGWMLDTLENLGFLYDSSVSVNSLYNKTNSDLGRVGTIPYFPAPGTLLPGGNRRLVEFPFPYWQGAGLRIPTAGGPVLRFLGAGVVLRGIRQSLSRGPTLFYFHPVDIAREKFPDVGKGRPLYWMIKGERVERRIRKVLDELRDVPKATLGDVRGGMG
ncbi:MAG: polysaccharide deacetylase family protein [Methanomicrobiales archaeon]|nr:polysaccharide deacetylase family protein [Methanomicrobiales archaeon]